MTFESREDRPGDDVPHDSSALLRSVRSRREKIWDAGFRPVPVYTVAAGRRFHHKKPGKHPFGAGWQNAARCTPPAAVTSPPRLDTTNTGILCDGLRPIDIDTDDPTVAARCVETACKMLGAAPIRYRSNSPRQLLLYRAAVGEPPKKKIKGTLGEIEVLGRGFGDHESGAELQWEGDAPGTALRGSVPAVTEDQINVYLKAVSPIIGCEISQQKVNGKDKQKATGKDQKKSKRGGYLSELLNRIVDGRALHDSVVSAAGYFAAYSEPVETAIAAILDAFDEVPEAERDERWQERRGDAERCVHNIYRKEADKRAASGEEGTKGSAQKSGADHETTDRLPDGILAPETALGFLNRKYMLVKEAGKAVIFEPLFDPTLQRRYFDRLRISDFKALYANRDVSLGYDGESKQIIIRRAADFWLRHAKRRQYLGGVVFRPGQAVDADTPNLWDGFAVPPQPGCCQRLYDHIDDVICCGDTALSSWLLNWIARTLQRPAERAEVCIVIRGTEEGSGKSTLSRVLMRLLGQHAFSITDSRHLIGGFNAHLRDCVFLLGDEAFYAGDKAHVGILKAIITEPTLTIEGKFRDAILVQNLLHVMMTANAEWVVPASLSARRFFVLDASDRHVGDHEYFRKLWAELDAGGLAAFLHDMLHRDLSGFNWRQPPDTMGLQEQKKRSLPTEHAWWMEVLHRGYVWQSKLGLGDHFAEWHDWVATDLLVASYQEFAKSNHEYSPLSREALGKFLRKFGVPGDMRNAVVGEHITDVEVDGGGSRREAALVKRERPHGYRFGSLDGARVAFISETRLTIEWEPVDDPFADA